MRKSIGRVLVAFFGVQLGGLLLSGWASLQIALGAHPESLQVIDWLAPSLSLFLLSWLLGRGHSWRAGCVVVLPNIVFWFLVHTAITSRFLPEFWRDTVEQLRLEHLLWWSLAIAICLAGAALGARFSTSKAMVGLVPVTFLIVSFVQWLSPRASGVQIEPDGTSVRLLSFDLRQVTMGLYDADSDDSHPFDDRNATWLGQAMPTVWSKIAAGEKREPLCVINGGFFGATGPLIGLHEAPLSTHGVTHYKSSILDNDWPEQNATLAWRRVNGLTRLLILRHAAFDDLRKYDGALGGVRVLIEDGKLSNTKPGMGGATLKCSRTTIGWNRHTNQFWILSVRDPDGEASSTRDNQIEKKSRRGGVQKGGWDVTQVQTFWQTHGATDAVLFDGGESGQIAERDFRGRWQWTHSSYHLTRTPGFWNQRPLRFVLPMLPPTIANGGVLNWFYVSAAT